MNRNKIINNRETMRRGPKGTDVLTCSICGKKMERRFSHDAYPVREESWYHEDANRCCEDCNWQIVMPIRLGLGRDAGGRHNQLKKMTYKQLLQLTQKKTA